MGGLHLDELESPVDAIAIWQGGLQFSGGFVFAVIAGYPVYRHWNRLTRWHSLDGYAYGLAIGLGIGRIGCYAVGEHFGSLTSFPLAVRYDGGSVREDFLGSVPLEHGDGVPPDRALRADLHGGALRASSSIVLYVRKPRPGPGTAMAIFCGFYGVARFASDSLRVNDETLLGPHRRPVPLPGAAPDQRLDLVPRPQAARRRTSRTACRSGIDAPGAEDEADDAATQAEA